MTDHQYITKEQLETLLLNAGVETLDVYVGSALYTPLSASWVEGELKEGWLDTLFSMGIRFGEPEDGDCNQFALWLASYASKLHRRTPGRPNPRAALALGEVWFTVDAGYDHAINWCVTGDGGVQTIRFLEPQSSQYGFHVLTASELQTIRLVKI